MILGFEVWFIGFRLVKSRRLKVQGLGFRVQGSGIRD